MAKPPFDSLISTQSLAVQMDAPDLVILDATRHLPAANRDASAEYAEAQIPTARFFDLAALVDETSGVPQAYPRPDQLAEMLASCGVSAQSRIVIYDDSAVRTSARAWWLLRAYGIGNVAILDGGLAKWRSEGRPLESGQPAIERTPPLALNATQRMRAKADMLDNIASETEQVLDARDAGRFSGSHVDAIHNMPSGHIPGSCNLPFPTLFNEDGTYKNSDTLSDLIAASGIKPEKPITTTCGSGVTACVLLFALHLTGRDDTALYDGSWLEWGSDANTPKAISGAEDSVHGG